MFSLLQKYAMSAELKDKNRRSAGSHMLNHWGICHSPSFNIAKKLSECGSAVVTPKKQIQAVVSAQILLSQEMYLKDFLIVLEWTTAF